MRLRYDTGTAFGFVRGGAVVVLPEGASSELVRALWDGIDAGSAQVEVIEVIQTLTVALGATLRTMPPFAVAVVSGRQVQVAVRGEVSVTLSTPTERVHVDGEGVSTWSERLVEDVESVSVQLGVDEAPELVAGPGQVALAGLPLGDGVVLMSRIVRELVEERGTDGDEHHVAVGAGALVRPPSSQRPVDVPPARALVTTVPMVPTGAAVPAVAVSTGPLPGDEAAPSPERPASDERDTPVSHETIAPEATVGPEAHEATIAPALPGRAEPVEEGYGHLWESTVLRTVEDAAIRVDDSAEPDADLPPVPLAPTGPADLAPAPAAIDDPGLPQTPAGPSTGETASMIDGIPREWTGSTPAAVDRAPAVEPEPALATSAVPGPPVRVLADAGQAVDDHDGHTVFSSVVADLRAQVGGSAAFVAPSAAPVALAPGGPPAPPAPAPAGPAFAPPPPPGAQQILARVCSEGHPNPASRDVCGRCGGALEGDARLVTRPSLGRLTLSNGQVVELDRPVVLGRRPRTTRAQSNDLPRLVAVPSPEQDISRSHVEIQLEDWHVFVCDLNTTNGTTLLRPGQPPRRLHPGEPMMVASHDVVDVGDGVTFVFEDLL